MGITSFDRATAVHPEGDGRYSAVIPDDWNAPLLPHGGIGIATALRAAEGALDLPDQTLRTVTGVFAGQVHSGAATIDVTVLRRGRSLSQVAVDLRNDDADAGQHVVAVYGAPRAGFEFTDIDMPEDVLSLEDSRPFEPPPDADNYPANFWEQVEGRVALGNFWLDTDWEPNGTSDRGYWYRFAEPPRRDDGTLDPLALVTLCDTMPGAVFQRMGPGPDAFCPSADLTVHILQPSVSDWVLAHNIARHVGDGYASLEQRLWDPEIGLVAIGTQISFFSFPNGPPEIIHPPR